MKKLQKRIVSIVAIVLALLMVGGLVFNAIVILTHAATSSALKQQLNDLKDEAKTIAARSEELSREIAENQSNTEDVVSKKSNIDQQMELTRQQIENLNDQIQQYNLMIAAKQDELEATRAEEERMNEQYKLRIRSMEESGDISYWSILFSASSFSDLLDRVDMIGEIAESDQKMIANIQEVAAQIQEAQAEIEEDRTDLETVKAQMDELQEQLTAQRAEADEVIAELAEKQGELESDAETYNAMQEQVRQQIQDVQAQYEKALADEEAARKIAEARKRAAANQIPKPNKNTTSSSSSSSGGGGGGGGGFMHPLGGAGYVSQAYGYREHPIYGYYSMHYGVDIAAGRGTPIYASKSGTVAGAAYSEINGYYVTINHNDGYASTYAHMTNYTVSPGQSVSRGEVIGYVGDSGWATGAHLHFELLYGGANVNPMDYI